VMGVRDVGVLIMGAAEVGLALPDKIHRAVRSSAGGRHQQFASGPLFDYVIIGSVTWDQLSRSKFEAACPLQLFRTWAKDWAARGTPSDNTINAFAVSAPGLSWAWQLD
jgi:hypothetical protein